MKIVGEKGNNATDENIVKLDALYKYGKFDKYTEKLFTHNEIYFSSPDEFNDPFDSKLHLTCDGTIKERKQYLCKMYQNKNPKLSKKEILTLVEKEIITKGRDETILNETMEKSREILRKRFGICCFSEKRDNILMWAHYARQHTGFCLEFNVDNDFISTSTRAIKVEYDAIWPELNVMRIDSYPEGELGRKIIIKANNWEYEQEWRIMDYEKGQGIQNFPEDALSGVIIGCRIERTNKKKLIRWCSKRKHRPTLYEAKEKQKEFGLDIVKFDY